MQHRDAVLLCARRVAFANPVTGKRTTRRRFRSAPFGGLASPPISAAISAGTRFYSSWLDEAGTPLTVQKELMHHAGIQTTIKSTARPWPTRSVRLTATLSMVLRPNKSEESSRLLVDAFDGGLATQRLTRRRPATPRTHTRAATPIGVVRELLPTGACGASCPGIAGPTEA